MIPRLPRYAPNGSASSFHTNRNSRIAAGHVPHDGGYGCGGGTASSSKPRSLPIVSNGEIVAHRLPKSVCAIGRPTQNHANTTIGPIVSTEPTRRADAAVTIRKKRSDTARTVHSRARFVSTVWSPEARGLPAD